MKRRKKNETNEERVTKYNREYEHYGEEGKNESEENGGMNIMSSNRKKNVKRRECVVCRRRKRTKLSLFF